MELKGAKCDDISSIKVTGLFCHATAFEFGDFNKAHHGWKAEFGVGAYKNKDMVSRGAKDNDVSSMIVEKRGGPGSGNGTSGGAYGKYGKYGSNGNNGNNGNGTSGSGRGINITNPFGWDPMHPFGGAGAASAVVAVLLSVFS
jgi:hypothetical protein